MPPEAAQLARVATLVMHINFWLSFPMIFFMAASFALSVLFRETRDGAI